MVPLTVHWNLSWCDRWRRPWWRHVPTQLSTFSGPLHNVSLSKM